MSRLKRPDAKTGRRILAPSTEPDWISFSFRHAVEGFRVADLSEPEITTFMNIMATRSQMTWPQAHADPGGLGVHMVPPERFRERIPPALRGEQILAFRCGGLRRLIGHRERNAFCVVWFDSNGVVYDHGA